MHFLGRNEEIYERNFETIPDNELGYYRNSRGTSMMGTIFLIVNATLGAGLLNFPLAFDRSGGVYSSILLQLLLLIFITMGLVILANSSDITKTVSMQDTLAGLCGPTSLIICGICVTIYSFGCCLTFIIIIGDQFDRVLATFYGMDYCHQWFLSRTFITSITCTIFILPLCFFKRLDVLTYASSIGCITILYVVWLIIYETIYSIDYPKEIKIWPNNLSQALQIVPIICFAYQSHMTAIPTYMSMKNRNLSKFTICSIISMIICFFAYTIVGVFGYKTFGIDKVPSDILQGYTDKTISLAAAIIAVAIKNFTTYPIVLFCGRNSLIGLITITTTSNDNENTNYYYHIGVTILWFLLSLIIAIVVPDIAPVINILGTLSAAFIFIFPGICLLQSVLIRDPSLYFNKNKFLIFIAILVTSLGAFISGLVFIQAIQDFSREPVDKIMVTGIKKNLGASLCT